MATANKWSLQAVQLSPNEIKIQKFIEEATGHRFPTLSKKFASLFSLYHFLNVHQNTDPRVLQQHITDNNQPMFSVDDIKQIQATIRQQRENPLSQENTRRILQRVKNEYQPLVESNMPVAAAVGGSRSRRRRGGAAQTIGVGTPVSGPPSVSLRDPTAPGYDPTDDMLGVPQRPGFVDKSRNSFFDRIFLKFGNMYENSPFALKFSHKWDGVFWFMFLLYNLENVDFFGPFLSAGLDAYVVAIRMAVDALHEGIPKILSTLGSILPIGVGGIAGDALGETLATLIGGFLLIGSIIVSISRKHFGDAFKASLEMIPVIGDFLLMLAMSAETNLDRINIYRNKLIHQLEGISPRLYNFVDYWVPKLEPVQPEAPPIPSLADIKDDIVSKGMEATGANKALAKVQNIAANPLGAAVAATGANAALPAMPTMPALPAMPPLPNVKVPNVTAPVANAVNATNVAKAVITKPNSNKAAFAPMPVKKRGGGGKTRKHRRIYKRSNRRHTNRRR